MAARHKRPDSGMTARQKQVLRAGAVAAPLTAGLMMSAITSASADEMGTEQFAQPATEQTAQPMTTEQQFAQPATEQTAQPMATEQQFAQPMSTVQSVQPAVTGQSSYPKNWAESGGALTQDQIHTQMMQDHHFTQYNPNLPQTPAEFQQKYQDFLSKYTSGSDQLDPSKFSVDGGQMNPDQSLRVVGKTSPVYGNEQVTQGTLVEATREDADPKVTVANKVAGTAGVDKIGPVPIKVGVSGEHSVSTEYAPPKFGAKIQEDQKFSFNPGRQGAQQVLVEPRAVYEPGAVMYGDVQLDDEEPAAALEANDGHPDHFLAVPGSMDINKAKPAPLQQTQSQTDEQTRLQNLQHQVSQSSPQAQNNEDQNTSHLSFDQANPYSPRYNGRIDWPWDGQNNGYNYQTGKYDQGSYDQWEKDHREHFAYFGDEANPYHPSYHARKGPDMGGYITDKTHYNYATGKYDGGQNAYWDWRRAHPELYPSDNG